MSPPSPDVVQAFGLEGVPEPLGGGRGLCYTVGDIVFKPSEDDNEAKWIAELVTRLLQRSPTSYRLARPLAIASQPGVFVYRGWTAASFMTGTPEASYEEKLRTSRAFHADLNSVVENKPTELARTPNRWNEADLVTWGEKRLDEVDCVNEQILAHFQPLLDRLGRAQQPLPAGVDFQLIHGDLNGNVLFDRDAGAPPAIIDLTFYWRPAEYAAAIIVADGLSWDGQGSGLVELYGTDEMRLQLLVRAMYWRCLTFSIDTDMEWVQRHLPNADYARAVGVVCSFPDRPQQCE